MKPTHIGLQAGALLLLLSTLPAGAFQAAVQTEASRHFSTPESVDTRTGHYGALVLTAEARNGIELADWIIRAAGERVPEDQMPEFCRSMAAEEMRVNLEDLSTLDPIVRSSGIVIQGEWDSPDDDRTAPFECRFDPHGVFQNFSR